MTAPTKHRLVLARERAGLSLGQAAKLLGITRSELAAMEEEPTLLDADAEPFAEIYGVNVEWLTGESELRDYTTVDSMKGADKLWPSDRDTLAEFAASMPRAETDTSACDDGSCTDDECACHIEECADCGESTGDGAPHPHVCGEGSR